MSDTSIVIYCYNKKLDSSDSLIQVIAEKTLSLFTLCRTTQVINLNFYSIGKNKKVINNLWLGKEIKPFVFVCFLN